MTKICHMGAHGAGSEIFFPSQLDEWSLPGSFTVAVLSLLSTSLGQASG